MTHTKDTVEWIIIRDHNGKIHLQSSKGAKMTFESPKAARSGMRTLVTHTMDALSAMLNEEFATIKFSLEC